ncbi:tyrosine-type recombinase/integrase [Calycomorphotria hydatis]|uniref:Site-specific tyrosine recombinase XerC n=1 Tax=Calycomorphotria hydatis TaxID=2528027 RepID=A0A517T5D9_9PLAN|nr:site-specific integrase [Calycomorphotria hydatis]QDT63561.1 site-specific tyrosine recombinase XerC [Calycomorphotria hydatis]
MPKRKYEVIQCSYFRWLLRERNGVYFADGRSNTPSLGRCSLGVREKESAIAALRQLDLVKAVEYGLASQQLLDANETRLLDLKKGRQLYEQHTERPEVMGGPRESTRKRYRAVLDKMMNFAAKNKIKYWNQIDRVFIERYAAWLVAEGYARASQYLEVTTIKQILKFLMDENHLPETKLPTVPIRKSHDSNTYCWKPHEVDRIIAHCNTEEMQWLRVIVIALASTGMRIGELASLRWSDIVGDYSQIVLKNESTSSRKGREDLRTTKGHRTRSLPIHETLQHVLRQVPRGSDGLVFHGPRGGKIKPDTVRQILVRDVLEPLAGEFPSEDGEPGFIDGRLHSFRHYFCSICANSGVPEQVLKSWMGHQSSRMIRRYYCLHDEESRRQINKINFEGSNQVGSMVLPATTVLKKEPIRSATKEY